MIAEQEKVLREKLAASHHIIHYHGWDDLLATHLSARIPNTEHLLITPLNTPFEEVCASKLIKCDFSGNVLAENGEKLMPQAINIHGEIYKHRADVMSAMHTHSIYGVAVSSLECGLMFSNQQSLRFYNDVAYHDYDGLALANEGKEIAKSMGTKKVMILRNHGLLITGRTIEEAMYILYYLETACKLQIKILSSGIKPIVLPRDICEKTKVQFDKVFSPEFEFQALTRRISGRSRVDYRS